jgi:hypothetical protein
MPMFQRLRDAITPGKGKSLARAFSRLGWIGFWLQLVFGAVTIVGMGYYFFAQPASEDRNGLPFVEFLTIADLLLLAFTTFWSYRYVWLARRIGDPARRPPESKVVNIVWTGVMASAIGLLFSMFVMVVEAAKLLYYFLKSPQAGIPVIQTSGAAAPHWVSSVDMVSLMALILTTFAELIVLVFSLWLLFRSTMASAEYPQTETA